MLAHPRWIVPLLDAEVDAKENQVVYQMIPMKGFKATEELGGQFLLLIQGGLASEEKAMAGMVVVEVKFNANKLSLRQITREAAAALIASMPFEEVEVNANGRLRPQMIMSQEEAAAFLASLREETFEDDHVVEPSSLGKAFYGSSQLTTLVKSLVRRIWHKLCTAEGGEVHHQGHYSPPREEREFNWIHVGYKGMRLVPCVRNQGARGTCVFYALAGAAEMEMARACALQGKESHLILDVPAFISHFEAVKGDPLESFKGNIVEAAIQHFQEYGVPVEGGGDHIKITAAQQPCLMSFPQVARLMRDGRAVIAGFNVAADLGNLKGKDIYRFHASHFDHSEGRSPDAHMVLFVGYGLKSASRLEWPYLIFLNSWGKEFGEGGAGRVYFDQLRDFITVSV